MMKRYKSPPHAYPLCKIFSCNKQSANKVLFKHQYVDLISIIKLGSDCQKTTHGNALPGKLVPDARFARE